MAFACAVQPHPVRAVCRASARCRLDRLPARAGRSRKAGAVGPAANGDPRKRAGLSARPRFERAQPGNHPRRGARRPRRAVGDGGGLKMRRPVLRDRRAVGRSGSARLHRDSTVGGGGGTQPHTLLAGAARGNCELKRRADALADREHAQHRQPARPTSAGAGSVGRRAVPGSRNGARAVDAHP